MSENAKFGTVINCMDGRTQISVNEYLRQKFGLNFVDTITEAGPVHIVAKGESDPLWISVKSRLDISVNKHGSRVIAIVAHHDCAGNPVDKMTQFSELTTAAAFLRRHYPECQVIKIWVGDDWQVEEK